jgi:hypothetical protein
MANVKKTLTDAGYIAVGLGVMGFQQAQIRGRELRDRAAKAGDCVGNSVGDLREKVGRQTEAAKQQAQTTRGQVQDKAQTQVRATVAKTKELGGSVQDKAQTQVRTTAAKAKELGGSVQDRLSEIPERVVQAMEPVTARVRELGGNAA